MYLCTAYGIVILEINSYNKELYLLNTVAFYPSLFRLAPKEKRTQLQALCIVMHLHLHLQHLTPRQALRFTPSTAIHNMMP